MNDAPQNGPRLRPDTGRAVAVTGARTFLGSELCSVLDDDPRYRRILALDIQPPELPETVEFEAIDLTSPTVGDRLTEVLTDGEIDTLVHGAFLTYPTHASGWAHELEDVGTMHVLEACARARVSRLILLSTTLVYGPSRTNPNFLGEDAELKGRPGSRYIMDKVRAERQVARFAEEHPEVEVVVLRFAPVLGPAVLNLYTRFLSRPVAPTIMGHDPLIQVVHESDAVSAAKLAVDSSVTGTFNIVGDGVLPYTTVLALLGRLPVPIPGFLARPLSRALWIAQLAASPPSLVDLLQYLCVADGRRAKSELGFRPRFDIRRTITDFLGVDEDGTAIARSHG